MGFSYDGLTGRLCCDACSNYTGVRKVRCPFNWCQATALCPECRSGKYKGFGSKGRVAEFHPDCERYSLQFKARQDREAALLATGQPVRCSALTVGDKVHVLFRAADGTTIGKYMSHAAYDSIPTLEPATPADYEALGGILTDAPADFNGRVTKEVAHA